MSKKYDHFQDYLEWEILEPEQEITHLTFETGLYVSSPESWPFKIRVKNFNFNLNYEKNTIYRVTDSDYSKTTGGRSSC